jgi:hypothetical protein
MMASYAFFLLMPFFSFVAMILRQVLKFESEFGKGTAFTFTLRKSK